MSLPKIQNCFYY